MFKFSSTILDAQRGGLVAQKRKKLAIKEIFLDIFRLYDPKPPILMAVKPAVINWEKILWYLQAFL